MEFLDALPQRHSTHDIEGAAETAFEASIEACRLFLVQQKDRKDYGTDVQIEARDGGSMTNLRVHVQLKGTEVGANVDGSVGIEVARTNLNYLLAQRDSIYVCYHLPSQRLLVRYASDVYQEYEHKGAEWRLQNRVTIKFSQDFDEKFQSSLNARVVASGKSARNTRLEWTTTPPDRIPMMVQRAIPAIEVPANPMQASELLIRLYDAGQDSVISKAFEQFAAVLAPLPGAMEAAYMAEINLGVNKLPFDEDRVLQGMQALQDTFERGKVHQGSFLYSLGNGWLALREYEKAREAYSQALFLLDDLPSLSAQCSKNMGSALEELGAVDTARAFYERALDLDPDLGEAHLALALWHLHNHGDHRLALEHLDRVLRQRGSSLPMSFVGGWRIELLFKIGDIDGAFREIHTLLSEADRFDWIWSWCARQVATFGRVSVKSAHKAVPFWRTYLREHQDDSNAARQLLLCRWYLRAAGEPTDIDFERFMLAAVELIDSGDSEPAFLWDRVGHWAQYDGNWAEAEKAYRKAYGLEPERYGYCLGTALNFLERYGESLPMLLRQAEEHQPTAMSWFHVAIAREGVGDIQGGIAAYRQALELDPDYALAWFNLGGLYWNSQDIEQAVATWRAAITRFPDHDLAEKLRQDFPFLPL